MPEVQRDSQEQEAEAREQREKTQNGEKRDKRFEGEDEAEVLHWQRWAILNCGGTQTGGVRGGSHSVIRRSRG